MYTAAIEYDCTAPERTKRILSMTRLQGNNRLSVRLLGSVALARRITPMVHIETLGANESCRPASLTYPPSDQPVNSGLYKLCMSSQAGYRRNYTGLGEMIDAAMAGVWVAVRRRKNLFPFFL